MIALLNRAQTTRLFPRRIPEPAALMVSEEGRAFSDWTDSHAGQAFYRALARQVRASLPLGRRARVLSVGEGEGHFLAALGALEPSWDLIGLELDPDTVARGRKRGRPLVAGSLFDLGSSSCPLGGPDLLEFDAVISVSSFHHFDPPHMALLAMREAAHAQGVAYLLDLRRDADLAAYFRRLNDHAAAQNWVKLRLFRDSVAAAHTVDELSEMLAPRGGARRLVLDPEARAEVALQVQYDLEALFLEAWI